MHEDPNAGKAEKQEKGGRKAGCTQQMVFNQNAWGGTVGVKYKNQQSSKKTQNSR